MIALAAIALTSSFWLLLDLVSAYSKSADTFGVSRFESRFDEFRRTLSPHAVFGYASDNPKTDPSFLAEYYLTQYTLAPAIIKASTDEPLVVLNFHTGTPDRAFLQARNLIPIQSFANGIVLCRKANP